MSPAAIVVAALAAAAAAPPAPAALAIPPLVVDLAAIAEVSPSVLATVIEETQALFRSAGVRFIWKRNERTFGALRVVVSSEVGPPREGRTALGWVVFENGEPSREIHLSYENAVRYLELSREVVGIVSQKTLAERDRLLGRALGRALAHELGHYLLATKDHTKEGLLKASRTAREFFAADRSSFEMNFAERRLIAARVRKEFDLVRRDN
jgi:hypothetical protein